MPTLAWSAEESCPVETGDEVEIFPNLSIRIDKVVERNGAHVATYTVFDHRSAKYLAHNMGTTSQTGRRYNLDPEAPIVEQAIVDEYAIAARARNADRREDRRKSERRVRDRIRVVLADLDDAAKAAVLAELESVLLKAVKGAE
ncbi:MAG: hypothetical protein JSS68_15140 [Actinobacteria bacterium]|nr:hypothetical protein [Actinomycetota bacterium]